MALSQHKIPIITGRNDVPTTSESQENHPNGSFTTAKYNALIDDIQATFNSLGSSNPQGFNTQGFNTSYLQIYVDADIGNDTTGDGSYTTPFQTLQKAFDYVEEQEGWFMPTFYLSGTFTNPNLDFSSYTIPLYSSYGSENQINIFQANGTAKIIHSRPYDYNLGTSDNELFVSGCPVKVSFWIPIELATDSDCITLSGDVEFDDCDITVTANFTGNNIFFLKDGTLSLINNTIVNNMVYNGNPYQPDLAIVHNSVVILHNQNYLNLVLRSYSSRIFLTGTTTSTATVAVYAQHSIIKNTTELTLTVEPSNILEQ